MTLPFTNAAFRNAISSVQHQPVVVDGGVGIEEGVDVSARGNPSKAN